MSDESRFDSDADRNPLDEQTVSEDEPPPGAEPVADGDGSTDEEDADDDPQERERREGTGESLETDDDAGEDE